MITRLTCVASGNRLLVMKVGGGGADGDNGLGTC